MSIFGKLALGTVLASSPDAGLAPDVETMRDELTEVQERLREEVRANCERPLGSFIVEDTLSKTSSGWVLATAIPLEGFSSAEQICIESKALALEWTSNRVLDELQRDESQIPVNVNVWLGNSTKDCGYELESREDARCIILMNENVFDGVWARLELELFSILPDGLSMEVKDMGAISKKLKVFDGNRRLFTIKILVPEETEEGVYTLMKDGKETGVKIKSPGFGRDFYTSVRDALESELRIAGY